MATLDYTSFRETFTDLVNEFGWSTAVLTVETAGAYNPATGAAAVSSVETTVDAVLLNLDRTWSGKTLQSGVVVTETDKKILLPTGVSPSVGDKIKFGTDTYDILYIKEINPGGTVIGYDLVVRNG